MVADVLMLKRIIGNPNKKAILVLPYVALVQEKLRWLRRVVDGVTRETNQEQHPTVCVEGDMKILFVSLDSSEGSNPELLGQIWTSLFTQLKRLGCNDPMILVLTIGRQILW